MKEIFDYRMYLSINGGEWQDTSIFPHFRYKEKSECVSWESTDLTFKDVLELIDRKQIVNAKCEKTLIRKKPRIVLSVADYNFAIRLTEKNFKTLKIKEVYEPFNGDFKTAQELLPANDFIQYLKDQIFGKD